MGNQKNQRKKKKNKQHTSVLLVDVVPPDDADKIPPPAIVTPVNQDVQSYSDDENSVEAYTYDYEEELALSLVHDFFSAIHGLFSDSPKLQKRWFAADRVVDAIRTLGKMPMTEVPNNNYDYESFYKAMLYGVGDMLGGELDCDHGTCVGGTIKSYFVATLPTESGIKYFIYVDLAAGAKTVPAPHLKENDWIESMTRHAIARIDFLPIEVVEMTNFWYSNEADKLFFPTEYETAHEAAVKMYELLNAAANDESKLRELIDGLAPGDELPVHEATGIPIKLPRASVQRLLQHKQLLCLFMARALKIAVDVDGFEGTVHWQNMCGEAVRQLNAVGLNTYTSKTGKAVREWFTVFRHRRKFPNPLLELNRYGPPFLLAHPETERRMKVKGDGNLEGLTCDLMHDWFLNTELPRVVNAYNILVPTEAEELSKEEYIAQYHLSKVCRSTIHNWILHCGFAHHEHKKGFYCDVHDRPDSIRDRITYSLYHVTELDFLMSVWVRLPRDRVIELQAEGRVMVGFFGYSCLGDDGLQEVSCELHVDDIEDVDLLPELKDVPKGGVLSKRMPVGAIEHVEWGHDEVVAHEKAMRSKCWHGSEGKVPLRPKDLGTSRHLSGFVSRQYGWCPIMSEAQLEEINRRREGSHYLAGEQATFVFGTTFKPPLDADEKSFYWSMRPGANNDGYWKLAHFVLQMENLMDVLDVLYPDEKHVMSLDHSNNHGGKRVGGLDLNALNGKFGGKQPIFDANMLNDPSCFGDHAKVYEDQLEHEDIQYYSFTGANSGPFWMTPKMRSETKYDQPTGVKKTRNLTKAELVAAIRVSCVGQPMAPGDLDKKSAASLRTMAGRLGIPSRVTETKVKEGWLAKPKGMLQLCWERRLIAGDAKPSQYTNAQLKTLLSACNDFKTELTLVAWVARERGYKVIFSPKAHPEVAGVGIEYVWACSKGWIQMIPLADRKGREKFDAVFKDCFGRGKLKDNTIRGCARAARQYMQAYILAHSEQLPGDNQAEFSFEDLKRCVNPIPLAKINLKMKSYKTHRSVADINQGQVRVIMAKAVAAEEDGSS